MSEPRIFVRHQGKRHGPFTVPAMIGAVKIGRFPANAPAWTDRNNQWQPLETILEECMEIAAPPPLSAQAAPPPPPATPAPPSAATPVPRLRPAHSPDRRTWPVPQRYWPAIGDSGAKDVIRTLPGTILGIGPNKIEVDCEFIQGNSGGPIINSDGRLVALASFMTANQSIWAKGTTHEIRRFGWIPSARYTWRTTSTTELANESLLVSKCAETSRLLATISFFTMQFNGFDLPDKWPKEQQYAISDIIAESEKHPLFLAMTIADEKLKHLSGPTATVHAAAFREYRKFLRSCLEYAESELGDAKRIAKSGFWRGTLNTRLAAHNEIHSEFHQSLANFKRSDMLGNSLIEY